MGNVDGYVVTIWEAPRTSGQEQADGHRDRTGRGNTDRWFTTYRSNPTVRRTVVGNVGGEPGRADEPFAHADCPVPGISGALSRKAYGTSTHLETTTGTLSSTD